ncbi:DUF2330 domain-containing protein [Candidatus Parcubacteria bacterium]|nr:DUF2330 domain-containing protein [Candidatus Parcubacteria bacterium]
MKKIIIAVILAFLIFPLQKLEADGVFIPYRGEDLWEPSQTALIVFDEGVEDLYLRVNYEGDVSKFVWIVPTPTLPDAEQANEKLFYELHEITKPKVTYNEKGNKSNWLMDNDFNQGVVVHSQEKIGIFNVAILSSDNSNNLYDWLSENGYMVPAEAKKLFDWYIEKGWFFTAVKIGSDENILLDFENKLIEKFGIKKNILDYADFIAEEVIDKFNNERNTYDHFYAWRDDLVRIYPELSFSSFSSQKFNIEFTVDEEDFENHINGYINLANKRVRQTRVYDLSHDLENLEFNIDGKIIQVKDSEKQKPIDKFIEVFINLIKTGVKPEKISSEINQIMVGSYKEYPKSKEMEKEICDRACSDSHGTLHIGGKVYRVCADNITNTFCREVNGEKLFARRIDAEYYEVMYNYYYKNDYLNDEQNKTFKAKMVYEIRKAIKNYKSEASGQLREAIHPLKLSFKSDRIIYPLKVSQFSTYSLSDTVEKLSKKYP